MSNPVVDVKISDRSNLGIISFQSISEPKLTDWEPGEEEGVVKGISNFVLFIKNY